MTLISTVIGNGDRPKFRGKLSETAFKRVFFVGLLLVGLHLVLKGLLYPPSC